MMRVKIDGMTCAHCAKAVTSALASVPGVTRVTEVSVAKGEATLEGSPEASAVVEAIRDAGYEAQPMP